MIICKIVLLAFLAMNLGIHLGKHGEPRTGRYNFWIELVAAATTLALYFGAGLFS